MNPFHALLNYLFPAPEDAGEAARLERAMADNQHCEAEFRRAANDAAGASFSEVIEAFGYVDQQHHRDS